MKVYADNAATTKMSRTAIDAMLPYMETIYGNPSSLYSIGCSVLAEEAIKAAVKNYYDKKGIEYDHSQFPDCETCEYCER
jgi:cysteine sulfinate desulfinase/cysteine desulfurase-like protein